MPRVDFYVLDAEDAAARDLFAARLAEKAWRQDHSVAILCANPAASSQLDTLLWNFRPDAFLPHDIAPAKAPVVIGDAFDSVKNFDLIINLSNSAPACGPEQRLIEIVIQTPVVLAETRARFAQYRRTDYQIFTHKMSGE